MPNYCGLYKYNHKSQFPLGIFGTERCINTTNSELKQIDRNSDEFEVVKPVDYNCFLKTSLKASKKKYHEGVTKVVIHWWGVYNMCPGGIAFDYSYAKAGISAITLHKPLTYTAVENIRWQ